MKKKTNILYLLSGVIIAGALQSCVSEDPFGNGSDGTLNLRAEINSNITVTRAEDLMDNSDLRDKCVVYIESNKGVVRKYIGLDNLPAAPISLKQGHYVAEAWTGDSVSASFSSKFYRGKEEFEIGAGDNKSLILKCNIANVIASVNQDALQLDLENLEVTFSHSRGSLVFNEDNIADSKGYFMMPNADSDLQYKVVGTKHDGTTVERIGVIEGVQRAHEYVLNITTENVENTFGGAWLKITIEDIPVIEDTINIYGRPAILGEDFDIDEQIVGDPTAAPGSFNAFSDKIIYIRGYEGLYRVELVGGDSFTGDNEFLSDVNLLNLGNLSKTDFEDIGITWDGPVERFDAVTGMRMEEMRITLKKKFFDELPLSDKEFTLDVVVRDAQNPTSKSNTKTVRIANTDAAIERKAPVQTIEAPDPLSEPMAVMAHSATLKGKIISEDVSEYGIKYRKQGNSEWTTVSASGTRSESNIFSVTLTNLEPGTTYEYKTYATDYDNSEVLTFTTESYFIIPNSSFEDWTTYGRSGLGLKNVVIPWNVGDKSASFWGSGNEGSAMASMTLTDKSTDMKHSGDYSARLESKSALGILAAGNIFIGEYVRTDGTNGVLSLGRPFNGSHPSKLKVWANYRPASGASVKSGSEGYVPADFNGGPDHAQIYVALTTEPVEIRTNPNDLKVFNSEDPVVLGYGQVTWTEAFGPDGSLEAVEIPIKYNSRAATMPATRLVVVVSASKYGDFFSGAAGSVMYLDDFELVYE